MKNNKKYSDSHWSRNKDDTTKQKRSRNVLRRIVIRGKWIYCSYVLHLEGRGKQRELFLPVFVFECKVRAVVAYIFRFVVWHRLESVRMQRGWWCRWSIFSSWACWTVIWSENGEHLIERKCSWRLRCTLFLCLRLWKTQPPQAESFHRFASSLYWNRRRENENGVSVCPFSRQTWNLLFKGSNCLACRPHYIGEWSLNISIMRSEYVKEKEQISS